MIQFNNKMNMLSLNYLSKVINLQFIYKYESMIFAYIKLYYYSEEKVKIFRLIDLKFKLAPYLKQNILIIGLYNITHYYYDTID